MGSQVSYAQGGMGEGPLRGVGGVETACVGQAGEPVVDAVGVKVELGRGQLPAPVPAPAAPASELTRRQDVVRQAEQDPLMAHRRLPLLVGAGALDVAAAV